MKIAIIGCAKQKRQGRHRAKDLYSSVLFGLGWRYAREHFPKVFILSAKYGLVGPDRFIRSYDSTLKGATVVKRRAWAKKAAAQIERQTPKGSELHFFCGRTYVEFLPEFLPKRKIYAPLSGLGLGRRLQWYKGHLGEAQRH